MNDVVLLSLTAVGSYLLGAVPFGFLIAKMRGIDIFKEGSGNIGATNVGRVLGRRFGFLVFTLDLLKGALPALIATVLTSRLKPDLPPDTLGVAAGIMAFLGHLFPIWLGFRGGKGVATGAGVVLVLLPLPTLGGFLAWLSVVAATRMVSLASMLAAATMCGLRLATTPDPFGPDNIVLTMFCLVAMLLVVARHRTNIRRLIASNENQLKDSTTMLTLSKVLHLLALGLWVGMGIFFSFVVAFVLFGSMESVALLEDEEAGRPSWFPPAKEYQQSPPSDKFPDPLRKEQGTRAAGHAISPMFDWYFIIQAACSFVALATALGWRRFGGKLQRVRSILLFVAFLTVCLGWRMEVETGWLRHDRNKSTERLLTSPSPENLGAAEKARASFGAMHSMSIVVNMVTLLLATTALALAAKMPEEPK